MEIRIRNAQRHDMAGMLALYRHLHAEADLPAEEEPLAHQVWNDILCDPKIHCLVTEVEGELIASCVLIMMPNLTHGARPYGLIENVVTHTEYRRRGLGTQILRHALQAAWKQGCYKVMLLTGSKRPEVLRFYEQAGFMQGDKTGFVARP